MTTVSRSYSFAVIKRRAALAFLLWISVALNDPSSLVSAGFVASPTNAVAVKQEQQQEHQQQEILQQQQRYSTTTTTTRLYHHSVPATTSTTTTSDFKRKRGHSTSNFMHTQLKYKTTTTAIRGGSNDHHDDNDKEERMVDSGGVVAGLFGNLRIPASLLAGASLGSAFSLPLAGTDGLKLGTVKRVYALFMMGSLSSMLLTVLVSTVCMNDIALSPPRYAKSVGDYIDQNYGLEWMAARTNFIWGNVVFVVGSMLRMWVWMSCPIIADGVLGIMGSLTIISLSIVLEFTRRQTGQTVMQQTKKSMNMVLARMQKNYLFGVGAVMWMTTVAYLSAKTPHMMQFLLSAP
jgi:hypothetical protein